MESSVKSYEDTSVVEQLLANMDAFSAHVGSNVVSRY